ncbi:MAG: beta-propeller domain-containing protein [Ornithinimicrobium sp.]
MRRLSALLSIPLLVGACSPADDKPTAPSAAPLSLVNVGSIAAFDTCEQLLGYYIDGALDLVGPYGLDGPYGNGGYGVEEGGWLQGGSEGSSDVAASAAEAGVQSAAPVVGNDFSGTNNQEAGVDEADTVKTDGSIIVALSEGALRIVGVEKGEVLATLALDDVAPESYQSEIVLHGDTLLVMSTGTVDDRSLWRSWLDSFGGDSSQSSVDVSRPGAPQASRTTITRIDVSDPSSPTVLGGTRMEGSYRSARLVGDSVRMVMESRPTGLEFVSPRNGSLRAERDALRANRDVIESSTLDDWVPHLETVGPGGDRGEVAPLSECTDVSRPDVFSGLSTLSVVTLDLAETQTNDAPAFTSTSSVSLVARGETVYASTDRLIVATSPWGQWAMPFEAQRAPQGTISTSLHSFDISDAQRTDYVASGQIEGTLINHFALSEVDGVIRAATTSEPSWWSTTAASDSQVSQSSLFVLTEEGEELVLRGSVGGLGKTERIKSVRYLGPDLAAVVTFRQTDPLYLIDTSDPTRPSVAGELKIPGYSSYLHPLDEDHLLGIGQDADPRTGREKGLQASLFDISDVAAPQRTDQLTWPGGYSPVEWDHRAFTLWPATGQFFVPAEIFNGTPEDFAGVVTGGFDGHRLTQGVLLPTSDSGPAWGPAAERTIVIGDEVWTVHPEGLNRYDLDTLDGGPVISW